MKAWLIFWQLSKRKRGTSPRTKRNGPYCKNIGFSFYPRERNSRAPKTAKRTRLKIRTRHFLTAKRMSRWAGEIKKATHSRRTSQASLLFGKPLTFSVVPISFRDKKMRGWFVCQPRIASPQAGITAIDLKRPLRTHQESSAELRSFSRLASYRELVLSIQSYRWDTSFNAWPFPK